MATVTLDQMKDKLLTIEQVTQALQKTEPLATLNISSDSTTKFHLESDWAHSIDALANTDTVGATVTIDGTELQISKEAMLQAGANFGLTAAYAKRLPSKLTEGLLNYHYGSGMGQHEYNVLSVGDVVSAFTRPSITPFSNLQLLEGVVESIQDRQGGDVPIFADYKFTNSLQQTNIRLIVPTEQRVMQNTNMQDVPENSEDTWLAGIHLSNSLIGKGMTSMEAYMFRWWCTNGATTSLDGVAAWSRKANGQNDDVYLWAKEQVDSVLGGLEHRFDEVQALARLDVGSLNTVDLLREIFRDYNVPVSQREDIKDALLGAPDLTMYQIMNAITQAANADGLSDDRRDKLMRIGGSFPTENFNSVKDQIWNEGHAADPDAISPYAIRTV